MNAHNTSSNLLILCDESIIANPMKMSFNEITGGSFHNRGNSKDDEFTEITSRKLSDGIDANDISDCNMSSSRGRRNTNNNSWEIDDCNDFYVLTTPDGGSVLS